MPPSFCRISAVDRHNPMETHVRPAWLWNNAITFCYKATSFLPTVIAPQHCIALQQSLGFGPIRKLLWSALLRCSHQYSQVVRTAFIG
jgi:hypothetical protein